MWLNLRGVQYVKTTGLHRCSYMAHGTGRQVSIIYRIGLQECDRAKYKMLGKILVGATGVTSAMLRENIGEIYQF